MTVKEAKKALEDVGLEIELKLDDEEKIDKSKTIIADQTPKLGIKSTVGGKVLCEI